MSKAHDIVGSPPKYLKDMVPGVRAVADATENYAYRFVDVGDPDHLVELRCVHGKRGYTLTVVDRRGYPLDAPARAEAPGAVAPAPRRSYLRYLAGR